jgi:glycosyltransferase involved in cell wall biosynthesis
MRRQIEKIVNNKHAKCVFLDESLRKETQRGHDRISAFRVAEELHCGRSGHEATGAQHLTDDQPELPMVNSGYNRSYEGPLVSIGMPVYNGERFVGQALESILVQDYGNFELIISDNASTDKTSEICQRHADRDKRIRYVRNETNLGASPNHKRVFEMARGDYFKWAAHDDECLPTFLSRCMSVFGGAPQSVVLVYPQTLIIDQEGRMMEEYRASIEAKTSQPHRRLANVLNNVVLGTPLYGVMRASALKQTRLIDAFFSSDYVLFAELAMLGEIWEIPELLLRKRFHPARSIVAHQTVQDYEAWLDTRCHRHLRVLSPCHKLAFEYVRSAWHLPLGPYERMMCSASGLYYHYRRHTGHWVGRWKGRLARFIRRVRA